MDKCKKKDCFYRRLIGNCGNYETQFCCGYLMETGDLRGCPADKCDKYISKKEAKALGMKYKNEC